MTTDDTAFAVRARGLVKTWGGHRALDGVDLDVPAGSVLALLGPNGAGKTTTVRILATLLRPDAGTALVHGHDVAREPDRVRRLIGLTGQYAALDEALTATENLVVIGRLLGLRPARRRAAELLEEFGLAEAARRPVSSFSGGMRRRLDIAASLVARPPVIFLDEPTTGLDPRTRAQMWETVRGLVAQGSSVLLTTQYLEEADQLADRVAVVDRGRVVADGTADALKASVGDARLHVRVPAERRTEAATVLAALTGADPSPVGADGLVGAVRSPAVSGDLVVALRERGIEVAEIAVQRPSLDDVFLALTGQGPDRTGPAESGAEEDVA
ncbi:ATP-binding cassette domain-containing protein [Nocardioides sp. zg-579]|uniref:ATP-binding cassette domain-containing protein n=1 Tax=Nocardioides marmotae TaxID=2663857 RepID=A0A6I3IZM8_9ACTN|nr:ATP-binding cassette domain-containing protein [Nocardioides marmotae]MCR6030951.1 ATP-binding cassette domain-containing protein [Gordonia jinghuaiqii]MTB94587.1 ATP-binding cassette domain-containing protein [Nocardioides marmotae]QKE01402.1 ATP-binding cassette domain-containing protein [Nocardioides marmotae]